MPTRFVEGASFDATTTTDGDGRFRIVDLPAGDYWLGPNPNVLRGVAAEAVAPIGATVTLPPDDEEVVLHLSRGLFIRGRVLDSSGAGRALSVRATWQAGTATAKWTSSASSDGRFEVGPLPSGEFGLRIEGPPWNADPGEPARAFAGEDDVVLRVTGWGRISGRVLDPSGSPAAAHVLVSCDVQAFVTFDADKRALRVKQEVPTNAQGEFEADGLGPGQYSLSAESDDGFVSVVRTVALARGESKPDVELRLEATATLVVELGEPLRYGRLEAFRDGVPVPIGAIWGAPTARLRLPAGDLVVRVMGPSPPGAAEVVAAEAHVVLAPNEKASIALRAR
ncbi:MAG TPA: carboxypeptidase-like regulatory domain-containing protein [Planctomycetota bacterium]|nr:carboxypeptidase-like regulatory domain-containing protein [Planctomycetota bacterium]